MLIVAKPQQVVQPTRVAELLAIDGQVTSDEYFHFFAQAFTDPAPAFREWDRTGSRRYPLLFTLKFLLARSCLGQSLSTYRDIVGAYAQSSFSGDEDQNAYIGLAQTRWDSPEHRQSRESIQVLSQISYLSATSEDVTVSLDPEDATDIFESLAPVGGPRAADNEGEILRLSGHFEEVVSGVDLTYAKTVLDQAVEAGFAEGTRVERTHLVLERNQALKRAFFAAYGATACQFCGRDTHAEYPWTPHVLDIHHVLPLCSGTRSDRDGTMLSDLAAICPTCHRAVHRYYARWLKNAGRKDFADPAEARIVYDEARSNWRGTQCLSQP